MENSRIREGLGIVANILVDRVEAAGRAGVFLGWWSGIRESESGEIAAPFYYRATGKMGEVIVGDLRPGFGTGGGVVSMPRCQLLTALGWSIGRAERTRRCVARYGVMEKDCGKACCWQAAPGGTGG